MQHLLKIDLTNGDKDYLRVRAHDGVRATVNDHEAYLGLILLQKFLKNIIEVVRYAY